MKRKLLLSLLVLLTLSSAWATAPTGAVNGVFSVSSTKRVYFAKGNLMYVGGATNKWQLHANQYEYCEGDANATVNTTNTSQIAEGTTFDLFGWATSGYNSKNPWMTSTTKTDYGPAGTTNITDANANYDWGVNNQIYLSDGTTSTGAAGTWRTLTEDEWVYLYSGRTNAASKWGRATIASTFEGLVFLPDDWTLPTGLSFTAGSSSYTSNTYTADQWIKMQAAGAIFLPTTGYRTGTNISDVGSYGVYWASTVYNVERAYNLYFAETFVSPSDFDNRDRGFSVRLVQEVPLASVTIGGTTTGYATFSAAFSAWNGSGSAATLTLNADVNSADASWPITVSGNGGGAGLTLNLNGHVIDHGLAAATSDGYVIKVNSGAKMTITDSQPSATHSPAITYTDPVTRETVTVNGGIITGGKNSNSGSNYGGGIFNEGNLTLTSGTISGNTASSRCGGGVYNRGTFIMTGGTICGNTASTEGGGVYNSTGTFTMSNGTVCGNTANSGGGVYNSTANTTFNLSGGTISGNTAYGGGGVYYVDTPYSTSYFNLSGNPTISGNKSKDRTTDNNVCLYNSTETYAPLITVVGELSYSTPIGVSTSDRYTDNYVFTSGYSTHNSAPLSTYFVCESPYQQMTLEGGEGKLERICTVTFNGNGATGGSMSAQNVHYNTATALNANGFTRTGYSFAGWATSADGDVVYANGADITLTANTTLYAQWTETVTWSSSDISGLYLSYGSKTINGIKVTVDGAASISSSYFTLNRIFDEGGYEYKEEGTITFSVTGGTISSIVINGSSFSASGLSSGWTATSTTVSWSGTPTSSVTLEADSWNEYATISSIVFGATIPNSGTTGECTWTFSNERKTVTITPTNGSSGAMADYTYSSNSPWGTEITEVVIENGVTNVGNYAFYECENLTSVTLPNSVTSIGNRAFYRGGMTTVTLPSSLTTIGADAFRISKLASISIPNTVTSIGSGAFGSTDLTAITIPSSVTSIGTSAFSSCTKLASITVEDGNSNYDSRNNCNALIETSTNKLIAGCKNSFIPSGVTTIAEDAFNYCRQITTISIPASVTSIENYAFYGCDGLTDLYLYHNDLSTLTVDNNAFYGCYHATYHGLVGATGTTQTTALSVTKDISTSAALTARQDPSNTSDYYTTYYNGLTDVTVPSGVKIYTGEVSGSDLNLTEINSGSHLIPIGTAVILKGTGTGTTTSIIATLEGTATAFDGTNSLHGVDVRTATPTDGTVYVLGMIEEQVGFYRYTADYLGAHKAYLKLNGSGAALAPALRFSFDESTGIESVGKAAPSESDAIYTLQGVRIAPSAMQKGNVYIVNGKKVIK